MLDAIDDLGLDVRTGESVSSVVADLAAAGGDGPVVLLRGDMDALPMPEDTGLEFASEIDGACTRAVTTRTRAMLVGAARLLARAPRRARRAPCGSCSSPAKKATTARAT